MSSNEEKCILDYAAFGSVSVKSIEAETTPLMEVLAAAAAK